MHIMSQNGHTILVSEHFGALCIKGLSIKPFIPLLLLLLFLLFD